MGSVLPGAQHLHLPVGSMGGRGFSIFRGERYRAGPQKLAEGVHCSHALILVCKYVNVSVKSPKDTYENKTSNSAPNTKAFT